MSDDPLVATPSQTVGPFFHFALTREPNGRLAERIQNATAISLTVTVTDADGQPVSDAMIELAQSGVFGRMPTDQNGCCEFIAVQPRGPRDFITVCVFARGLLRHLHTRIYLSDPSTVADDPVMQLVPAHRRDTLFARRDPAATDHWHFALRLQGTNETVFFDA